MKTLTKAALAIAVVVAAAQANAQVTFTRIRAFRVVRSLRKPTSPTLAVSASMTALALSW